MPKDSVLRSCVLATRNGQTEIQIIDTVESGDFYLLVMEWMFIPGREGEHPKRTIPVKKGRFQVTHDVKLGFELLLPQPINMDEIVFTDIEVDEEEIWAEPDNLFTPRPKDED